MAHILGVVLINNTVWAHICFNYSVVSAVVIVILFSNISSLFGVKDGVPFGRLISCYYISGLVHKQDKDISIKSFTLWNPCTSYSANPWSYTLFLKLKYRLKSFVNFAYLFIFNQIAKNWLVVFFKASTFGYGSGTVCPSGPSSLIR
jgi:hypothetical protein